MPLRSVLSLLKIDLQTAAHLTGNVRKEEGLNFIGIPTTVIRKRIIQKKPMYRPSNRIG